MGIPYKRAYALSSYALAYVALKLTPADQEDVPPQGLLEKVRAALAQGVAGVLGNHTNRLVILFIYISSMSCNVLKNCHDQLYDVHI